MHEIFADLCPFESFCKLFAAYCLEVFANFFLRGMFEMNCLLSSSSISTWGMIKTNTCLYRAIQYLHNGV